MDFSSFFSYPNLPAPDHPEDLVLLPDLSDENWDKLLAQTARVRFRAGEVVIRHGEAERALYIVADGSLEVFLPRTGDRSEQQITTIDTGSVIGELAFFDGLPRSASVRALTDGEMLRLSYESFEVLSAREPALARALIFDLGRIISLRLRQLDIVISG